MNLFFLYGEDQVRSRRKLGEIIDEYVKVGHNRGFNLLRLDASQLGADELLVQLKSRALFSAKRLIVFENVLNNPAVSQIVLDYLKKSIKTGKREEIAVFWEPGRPNDRPGSLFNFLLKEAKIQKFELSEPVPNIFETMEAVTLGDRAKALKMISRHLENNDSPVYLLAMLAHQFRQLLVVREMLEKKISPERMPGFSGLKPFVVAKLINQAKKIDLVTLKKKYASLLNVDLKIKTGQVLPRPGLEFFIIENSG
jgi:DNA polymerase III delta subunit